MDELLLTAAANHPERLVTAGDVAMYSAQALLVAGMFGKVATTAMSSLSVLGTKAAERSKTLAELFPDLPTWWIPESTEAFIAAAALMAAGLWVRYVGRRYQRVFGL
jgi:hypothetical protein